MKRLNRITAVLLVILLCVSLCACKKNNDAQTQKLVPFDPVVFEGDKFKITVLGCEQIKDYNNHDALRVFYDFENKYEVPTSSDEAVSFIAYQNSEEISIAYPNSDYYINETSNNTLRIYNGVKLRCVQQFSCKVDGGKIDVKIVENGNDENNIDIEFDLNALSGAPEKIESNEYTYNEGYFSYLTESGVIADYYNVKVLNSEKIKSADDSDCIRIYYEFTNNSNIDSAFWSTVGTRIVVSQGGISLYSVKPKTTVAEDDNYSENIKPGETIKVSKCYKLTADSPVYLEILGLYADDVGKVFS